MSIKGLKFIFSMTSIGLLLLFSSMAWAQEEPNECVVLGALAWDNWTLDDAGGSGLPVGEADKDYFRCKACHGWDQRGTDGGYVTRSRKDGRPNAGFGDGDQTSRNISFADRDEDAVAVTAEMIFHAGTGRSFEDGTGSWVPLDESPSAANTAAHANGYTLGNQHPDFTTGGANALTQEQADCLAEFLNYEDAGWKAYFDAINPNTNPVSYTIRADADAARGETRYTDVCFDCHGNPAEVGTPFDIEGGGILEFLASTPHFSEFYNKARWGHPDSMMTRDAIENPTALDVADLMLYLQELGGTGFAITPGITGTWWNGLVRDGEGLPIQVGFQADGTMILWVTFYTYDSDGNQAWLVAFGTVDGDTVNVDVFITDGRFWGDAFDPAEGSTTAWGVGTFKFTSCTSGEMTLMPNPEMVALGYTDLGYALQRFDDFVKSGIACPTTAAQQAANLADHDHDAH